MRVCYRLDARALSFCYLRRLFDLSITYFVKHPTPLPTERRLLSRTTAAASQDPAGPSVPPTRCFPVPAAEPRAAE